MKRAREDVDALIRDMRIMGVVFVLVGFLASVTADGNMARLGSYFAISVGLLMTALASATICIVTTLREAADNER